MSFLKRVVRFIKIKIDALMRKKENPIEVIETKIMELRQQQKDLKSNPSFTKALGRPAQLNEELMTLKTDFKKKKYDTKIAALLQEGNEETAKQFLLNKKRDKAKLDSLAEQYAQACTIKEGIEKKQDLLKSQVERAEAMLEDAKRRAENAEINQDVYALLGNVSDINNNTDTDMIDRQIREMEQIGHGMAAQFETDNRTLMAERDLELNSLDDELEQYR